MVPIKAHARCSSGASCANSPDLGTLPGGIASYANGVSADGSVVTGISDGTGFTIHAFRWSGGVMSDLGTLAGGTHSFAEGVNADGSVIAGIGDGTGFVLHAFRWTAATGMQDLGALAGGTLSLANAVNGDGSVVVGLSNGTGFDYHAFRWSSGVMSDLGTLTGGDRSIAFGVNGSGSVVVGGANGAGFLEHAVRWNGGVISDLGALTGGNLSLANSVSADGSVVAGSSDGTGFTEHAFRWTGGVMSDLGTLTGGNQSAARGIDASGSIVVGHADGAGFAEHAFRWTAATGMKDINTLLADAGVNMTGITLTRATGVSANGQFIVGYGSFPAGSILAYLARYYDGIGGITDARSVQSSIDALAQARRGLAAQQQGLAAPLLDADNPLDQTSQAGVFGAAGSATGGVTARYMLGGGLSVRGGVSYAREDYENGRLNSAAMGALALRYVSGGTGAIQPFVEGGGWFAPDTSMSFSRTYVNGAGAATGTGKTEGGIGYYYGRAGVATDLAKGGQLAVSGEIGQEILHVNAYAEPLSAANPFEARVNSGDDTMTLAKLRVQYTASLTARVDGAVYVAVVRTFNQSSGLSAAVDGFGAFAPASLPETVWAEFGVRAGYKLTDNVTFDVFSGGVAGREGVGTEVHSGAGLRIRF
jgi:probable HAF family extracellular repeat protein